jgi:hypothetical protein
MSPRIQEVVLVNERFLGHQYIFFSLNISNISASFAAIPSFDSFGQAVSEEKIFLEINRSETRIACGGHVC